jgi:hypothetical protein
MTARARLVDGARWLHARLSHTRLGRELDARLDLAYLADRVANERARVERLLGPAPTRHDDTPLLSLILPSHGVPVGYLRALIASLDRQSFRRWELCACDDGDPVRAAPALLARRAAAEPARFRLARHATNRGIAAATRSAIALARGEALVFVDEDDLLHPRALEALAKRFAEPEVDLVYTDHDQASEAGHRRRLVLKPAWSPELLLSTNYINHLVAIRARCYARCDGALGDETSGSQDWDLCLRAGRAARRVAHVPLPLYHWRARPGSLADDARAKPWATAAARRVVERHLAALDPRLSLDRGRRALRFRDGTAPHVTLLAARAGADLAATARALDAAAAALDDAAILRVAVEDAPPIRVEPGDGDELAAFAVQPAVGCVWPFRAGTDGLRGAYTVEESALVALAAPRSSFSGMSGNVLTGPLHGLTVRAGALRAAGGFAGALAASGGAATDEPALLGAALGLACLRAGRRNVAARGGSSALAPPRLALRGLPPLDPYL